MPGSAGSTDDLDLLMATDQFNIRLRDGLDRQVRVHAAQSGCHPRDVIEDALVAFGFTRQAGALQSAPAAPPEPPSPPEGAAITDPEPAAPEGNRGCPECGGELQLVDDSRDGRRDRYLRCEDCSYTEPLPG